ncbi:MAG: hypothetical protein OER21_06130 [Gemmatimonadota bacterium]|nr:hypothetical protein [Gemmatimonadota bacterium]
MSFTSVRFAAAVLVGAAVVGCSMQQGSAEKAIAAADSALQAAGAEAQAYVPDQVQALHAQLAAARTDLESKQYGEAITKAQEVATQAGGLGAVVAAKKAELTETWETMSGSLPGMVSAIETKVAELAKMRRLPAGMDKAKLDGATAALQEMTATWSKAQAAFGTGAVAEAVTMGGTVQARATETMAALGMKKM